LNKAEQGIDTTGAHLVHVPRWMDGWLGGWMEVKAIFRIAYGNQKRNDLVFKCLISQTISRLQMV
jgi:hypothetical protein